MATKQEVRQRVGENLSIVEFGQALESQDAARIDQTFGEVYTRLKSKGLAVWASTAEVPEELVPYYALMMEEKLLTSFSVPQSRYDRIKFDAGDNGDKALAAISELVVPKYESTDDTTDF